MGPDGLMAVFFKAYWSFMSMEFTTMVNESLRRSWFPSGVTYGLIVPLFEGGDRLKLTNSRPITLLNTTYKIFVRALQRCLQPLLVEEIDSDQIVFFPFRFILDNILFTHEFIQWTRELRYNSIFLKLDFSRAYDRVD